ncbi:synemin-like [Myxocyprinus asiaticus]|uniref:synemin-like n=1 Tax=Myxocyprinus asiaticus TaxID=70543 RepID=UPI0022231F14|nr:synemin-like [Myxocyprinus asiaticus]
MFRMRQPFESEKLQLQELNQKLSQYLMRAKQLEQENTCLVSEINSIRQKRSGEWENKHMSELREMRRLAERLSFEKCRAEMEREKLRNELQMLHAMRSDEASVSKGIDSELKGCERQLHHDLQTNTALEDRLIQLENEYKFLEDAHRIEIAHLRDQVHSRTVRVVTQTHHAPTTVTMEEVQEYAANFTESWKDTLDMYRLKVEEIEESIKADQARLEDIQREKKEYALQFKRLREEIEQQTHVQLNLEEQLMNMQENFRAEINQYQVIIEDLEYERRLLSNTISEKLKDHQDLVQVKMGLALEVAAYRALLEEEGRHAQMWSNQQSRERIIDIKMPAHPFTPRLSSIPGSQPDTRKHFTGYDVKYMEPISSMRTSDVSSQFYSHGPSRLVPISVSNRAQQSPASRRDMISFTKAVQAAAASSPKEVSKHLPPKIESTSTSKISQIAQPKPVKVLSPIGLSKATTEESHQKDVEMKEKRMDGKLTVKEERQYVKVKESKAKDEREFESHQKDAEKRMNAKQDTDRVKATAKYETQHVKIKEERKPIDERESKVFVGEEKVLDAVSMEEIMQQVMKPAGLDTKVSSSPDSKVTYHVEKTKQDDGTTKTQIVLQTKVEEELDLSEDSGLEEFLSKGVKKVTLENIKGTPTGNMIENLLSLGLQGESLGNRSVNVEIIEEPVESQSDEEDETEIKETVEIKSQQPNIKPSSMFFQIEELESEPKTTKPCEGSSKTVEGIRDESLPYFSHGQEPQEYFVSTPEDNMSEEGERFMSFTHYGVVDDLSDERYYQEDEPKRSTAEGHSYRDSPEYGDHSFVRDSIQECIIEEEVLVSPTLQKSIVGMLTGESLDPKQQLRGALEQIQGNISGALKEELAFLTKGGETPDNVSVDIKKVEQATDNGTMTIVAELNVSQTLEDSGLLEEEQDDPSEEQIMAALSSSHPGLQQALRGGAGIGYTMKVSQEEFQTEGIPWMTSNEEIGHWSSDEVSKTEKHIKLGPSERSFTFQMDVNNSSSASTSGGTGEAEERRGSGATEFLQTQMIDPHMKVCHEKRIATVYLESPKDD